MIGRRGGGGGWSPLRVLGEEDVEEGVEKNPFEGEHLMEDDCSLFDLHSTLLRWGLPGGRSS